MASPITPSTGRALSLMPGARVLQSPLSDETIWKRLKDVGFDEESIKRRDKAALIAYIAKLESQIFDLQHHMGLLILERKELASHYEQIKASTEAAELARKRDQAAHVSALAEASKREQSLKKALRIEKECIASIEKALHEMRAESAETKVAADCKLAEARTMTEEAHKKYMDAQTKLNAAETLQAEASLYRRTAERKLQEFEAREDDLSRRISDFKAECDAKEKDISLERQTLSERRKVLQQEQERLLDGQASLNQREDHIATKSQELNQLEKELEAAKSKIERELRDLNDEKSKMELAVTSFSQREEAVIEREAMLSKREQELLVLQEKKTIKESVEIQKAIADHETALRTRTSEFEAELEVKRKLVEDEMEAKRRSWELKEVDISQREDLLSEREHDLEIQARALMDKEKDTAEKMNLLDEKEKSLRDTEKDIELRKAILQKEKEEINKMKLELHKSLESLEDKKKQVDHAKERLETMKSETDELSVLEINLQEEVETVRSQKLELMAEEDRLKGEKAKFELEWELIDEKREELRNDAERVAEDRKAILRFLKNERDSLRQEKEAMQAQHRYDVESLNREREEFMNKMVQERSEWFSKIEQEHADFLLGIEMQKRELETSIEERREEVECYLRDKERTFELEKKNELQHISSLREKAMKELEQAALEMKKLETERQEMNLERERRDNEWAVLNKSIEDLKSQTQKLEKQRELLHAEREEICSQIEHLKKLEDLKLALDSMELAEMQQSNMESNKRKISAIRYSKQHDNVQEGDLVLHRSIGTSGNGIDAPMQKQEVASPPNSAPFSWIKRCTELIFKNSPEKSATKIEERPSISNHEHKRLTSDGKLDYSNGYNGQKIKATKILDKRQPMRRAFGKSKVILEVPPEGKSSKEMHDIEDANKRITYSISEQVLQDGRKRRVTDSDFEDCIDPLQERRNNKKRRQGENAVLELFEDDINNCATPQANVEEDQFSTEGIAENTDVVIVEKLIKISEVTSEITDKDKIINQENLEHLQDSEAAPDQNIVQDGGNEVMYLGNIENRMASCGLVAPEMSLEEHMENIDRRVEQIQCLEDASEKGDLRVEDDPVAKSDDGEKVTENVGRRTRMKKKT